MGASSTPASPAMRPDMAQADGDHPAAVHAVELDQPSALDRAAHLQPEVGEPHQDHEGDQDHGGGHHRGQVDPVDRGVGDPEVHGVRVEQDAGRVVLVAVAEEHRQHVRESRRAG